MSFSPPTIPSLSSKTSVEVRRAFDSLRGWLDGVRKAGGFASTGTVSKMLSEQVVTGLPEALQPYDDLTVPPKPTGVTATGAFNNILVSWDEWASLNLAYTEIWRNTENNSGTAVMIGTSISTQFMDTPAEASLSTVYYYWVRHVSKANYSGPYSDMASAHTANNPSFMIDVLSDTLDSITPTDLGTTQLVIPAEIFAIRMAADDPGEYEYPFIVANTPAPGDPIEGPFTGPPAVFMNTAYIGEATIENAMIKDLAADKLTVPGTASIWDAIITTGKITNAYIGDIIQSTTYSAANHIGWKIDKNGLAEFNGLIIGPASSGYSNLEDVPTSLSQISSTEATKLNGIAAGATVGAPSGTAVGNSTADAVAAAVTNYNTSNDNDGSAITAPTVANDSTALDHVINTDGSADISFEWSSSYTNASIDGFILYIQDNGTTAPTARFTAFTTTTTVLVDKYELPATAKAFILRGVPANHYYTFGIQAYRKVNSTVAASGLITSAVSQPLASAPETTNGAYRPASSVAFAGDISGTINGTSAATVASQAAAAGATTTLVNSWAKVGDGTKIDGDKLSTVTAFITTAMIKDAQITTATIGSAQVTTLKIGDEQVTVPRSAFTAAAISCGGLTTIQSITYSLPTGGVYPIKAVITVSATFYGNFSVGDGSSFGIMSFTVNVKKAGTTVYTYSGSVYGSDEVAIPFSATFLDTITASTSYILEAFVGSSGNTKTASNRCIVIMGVAR